MKKLTATQRMNESWARTLLQYCHILFEEEKNPLFAWQAYQASQELRVPIPCWVLDYLNEVAENLLNPSQPSADERAGVTIQKALLMNKKGRGNVFLRYADFHDRWNALNQVRELLEKGETLDNAFNKISKKINLSKEAVKKWYYAS
jgi:type I restriction-modification system DNA methylase subunit